MTIEAREFQASDVHSLINHSRDVVFNPEMVESDESSMALTLTKDGEVLASMGAIILWEHVAEGWAILSQAGIMSPVAVTRFARQFIYEGMISLNLHRLQSVCDDRFPAHARWAQAIGFGIEGEMPLYTPDGATFIRLAIYRGH